ncbi:hypothetical protein LguiA_004930 [Lonicera macranthoides]
MAGRESIPGAVSPTLAPEADANPALTPPSTTGTARAPTTNSDSQPVLTPSAAAKTSHEKFTKWKGCDKLLRESAAPLAAALSVDILVLSSTPSN